MLNLYRLGGFLPEGDEAVDALVIAGSVLQAQALYRAHYKLPFDAHISMTQLIEEVTVRDQTQGPRVIETPEVSILQAMRKAA